MDDRDVAQFFRACQTGKLEDAVRIADEINITGEEVRSGGNLLFITACTYGHLDVAQWLSEKFEFTSADASLDDSSDSRGAFRAACIGGHFEIAQWLVERFNFDPAIIRIRCWEIMPWVCQQQNLEFVQWISELFDLTSEDVRHGRNAMLRAACAGGRLDVAQWLTGRFGLTAEDARADDNYALKMSMNMGHADVVLWLLDFMEPNPEERASILGWVSEEAHAIRGLIENWQPPPGPGDKPARD